MIHFFGNINSKIFAVQTTKELSIETITKLSWLFANPELPARPAGRDSGTNLYIEQASLDAFFVGPRAAMVTPWSTNAVEITQNMAIKGV